MPMDAYRESDSFNVHFDLPGVQAGSIVLTVEHNVLTISAERLPQRLTAPVHFRLQCVQPLAPEAAILV